jgi:hypothetical protein
VDGGTKPGINQPRPRRSAITHLSSQGSARPSQRHPNRRGQATASQGVLPVGRERSGGQDKSQRLSPKRVPGCEDRAGVSGSFPSAVSAKSAKT